MLFDWNNWIYSLLRLELKQEKSLWGYYFFCRKAHVKQIILCTRILFNNNINYTFPRLMSQILPLLKAILQIDDLIFKENFGRGTCFKFIYHLFDWMRNHFCDFIFLLDFYLSNLSHYPASARHRWFQPLKKKGEIVSKFYIMKEKSSMKFKELIWVVHVERGNILQ